MKSVAIIGGGPAGLAAGIAAQCAGLQATIIAPDLGGRFIESPRIENILGFPLGVSGATYAQRAIEQAERFGVKFYEGKAENISERGGHFGVIGTPTNGEDIFIHKSDAVVIATGMRMTDGQFHTPHEGTGPAVVVGAGDAAVQVALGHASRGEDTILVVRGNSLRVCSPYLRERVENEPNIEVLYNTEFAGRDSGLARMNIAGSTFSMKAGSVQMLVGAQVDASWAGVLTDEKGFILTDSQFHTSRPHVYAVGDVRAGSIKRIGVAAGEGTAVGFIIARALGVMP